MTTALVAIAGALGAVVRYRVGLAVGARIFPWSTLFINVAGSVLLGVLMGAAMAGRWRPEITVAVGVGFLGAFTTFSTFGYETFTLLRVGRTTTAALYVGTSLLLGVCGAAVGYGVGRTLA